MCSNNILVGNQLKNNSYNLKIDARTLFDHYIHNIDTSNTINGKSIYYWINKQNDIIPSDAGFVGLINCNNIVVKNLTLSNNEPGILVAYSNNILLKNINITLCQTACILRYSSNISIYDCIFNNNSWGR